MSKIKFYTSHCARCIILKRMMGNNGIEYVEIDDENISLDFLTRIIQELPDRYRLVFNLYVLDGYSHKEIAEMLEINIGTSKSNLARAKAILKNKIESNNSFEVKKSKWKTIKI